MSRFKPRALLLALSVFATGDAKASPVPSFEIKPLAANHVLSPEVRAAMPTGSHTRFAGVCQIPSLQTRLLLHFYEVPFSAREMAMRVEGYANSNLRLDVFQRTAAKTSPHWEKINSVCIKANELDNGLSFDRIGFNWQWLDPAQRKMPILNLDLHDGNGFYGETGYNILLVFPQGLRAPAVKDVSFYGWKQVNQYFGGTNLNVLDERGLAMERSKSVEEGTELLGVSEARWNGHGFTRSFTPKPAPQIGAEQK